MGYYEIDELIAKVERRADDHAEERDSLIEKEIVSLRDEAKKAPSMELDW